MKKITFLIAAMFFAFAGFSQGLTENELTTNAVLVRKYNEMKSVHRLPSIYDTLTVGPAGILDDFSKPGPYPDTAIWMDDHAFINRTYPKAPVTIGVATFDGLDYNGYPYDFSAAPSSSALADYLTSKPIKLNYPATDSIYLSFYYQPQGRGNAPEYLDSLVLQFKDSASWRNVWAQKGTTLATSDSSWKLVMIPVTDSMYLQDGFQFRFYNRATLSGNTDHWNIDYVYLNRFRTKADTVFEDVAMVYDTPSLITPYTAMPWKQYDTTFMKTNYASVIRNNNTATKIITDYNYKIFNAMGVQVNSTYSGGTSNINPFETTGYLNYAPHTTPALNYKIPALTTADRYSIESYLYSSPDKDRNNDTVRHTQDLTNYFAYDDGTAENSFGLSTLSAELAEQFTLRVADSLQFIDIFFNPFLTNTSVYTFDLKVWADAGGMPGLPIYSSSSPQTPAYSGVTYNDFIRYKLDAPLYLGAGKFYVGFLQNTNQFLNIGVDKNTNTQSKIFYNVSGPWYNSPFAGSLMLHPVFGSASEFTGIEPVAKAKDLSLYPNPAGEELHVAFADGMKQEFSYYVSDILGKKIIPESVSTGNIDISSLNSGIYFITVNDEKGMHTLKFIKAK
ncbi:MAG: T9SS type A sorting domain-containing protein [Bacteroidia bacterium]